VVTKRKLRRRRRKEAEKVRDVLIKALDEFIIKQMLRNLCKVDYQKPSPFIYIDTT